MRTSEIIRQTITGQSQGSVFSSTDFLSAATRAAVDQALFRLMKAGVIDRVARGLYVAAGHQVDVKMAEVYKYFRKLINAYEIRAVQKLRT